MAMGRSPEAGTPCLEASGKVETGEMIRIAYSSRSGVTIGIECGSKSGMTIGIE